MSEGWVRCGRCDAVFNALEGLFDLGRDAPPDWAEPPMDPLVASLAPRPPEWETLPPPVEADEPEERAEALETDGVDSAANLGELLTDPIDAHLFGPRKRAESAPKPAGQLGPRDRVEFSDARFDSDLFLENTSVQDTELVVPTTDAAALPLESAVRPEFIRRADRRARWESPAMRGTLAAACVLALAALALQVMNHYRDVLAATSPSLRPVLDAWCRAAQCRIEAPRRLDDVVVESSSLTRAAGQDAFVLSVTLRSRSDLTLAMPSLDLTLTDANGRLVARRALAPRDLRTADVIAPRAETGLQVLLSAGTPSVVGYTVEIFYP